MTVRSEFQSQVLSYLVGSLDLKSFREWQLAQLVDRNDLGRSEMEMLLAIEGRYADMLAGAPESSFKDSLKLLLSSEATQAPVQYILRSYTISASPVVVDSVPSQNQSAFVSGAFVANEAITIS